MQKSSDCPVEFVYDYPKEPKDGRRWIGGLVRCQKYSTDNLHNHKLHAASKISQCVQSKIAAAITTNPSLTTADITCGKGLGFLPAAVDGASCNSDRVSLAVKRAKVKTGLTEKHWSPLDFEEVANSIDREDNDFSGDGNDKLEIYRRIGRPYLVSAGLEAGIKFIFTMSPHMATIAANSEFIQTDITYDNCKEYTYIINAVSFNCILPWNGWLLQE